MRTIGMADVIIPAIANGRPFSNPRLLLIFTIAIIPKISPGIAVSGPNKIHATPSTKEAIANLEVRDLSPCAFIFASFVVPLKATPHKKSTQYEICLTRGDLFLAVVY